MQLLLKQSNPLTDKTFVREKTFTDHGRDLAPPETNAQVKMEAQVIYLRRNGKGNQSRSKILGRVGN